MSNEAEFDRKIDAEQESLDRMNRAARLRNIALVIVAILALVFGLVSGWLAFENDRLANANAQYGAEQAQEKQTIAKEAQKALCGTKDREIYDPELCAKWAEAADEPAPPPVDAPALVGPSQEELVEAFREHCAAGNCRGRDGATPTPDDIAAAFMGFCATRDGCRGPAGKDAPPAQDGKDGVDGKPGADGQSVGPSTEMVLSVVATYCASRNDCRGPAGAEGPPPPEAAIIAAVQKVCANDACRGPAGAAGANGQNGADGQPGEPGRGVADTHCQDNGIWQITYTDGTVDSDAGRCRTDTIPPAVGVTP